MGTLKYSALKKKKAVEADVKAPTPAAAAKPAPTTKKTQPSAAKEGPPSKRQRVETQQPVSQQSKGKKVAQKQQPAPVEDDDEDDPDQYEDGHFVPVKGAAKDLDDDEPVNLDWSDSDDDYIDDEPSMESGDDQPFEEEDTDINPNPTKQKKNISQKDVAKANQKANEAMTKAKAKKDVKQSGLSTVVGTGKKSADNGAAAGKKKLIETPTAPLVQAPPKLSAKQIIAQVAFGKKKTADLAADAKGPMPFEETATAKATASGSKLIDQVSKLTSVTTASAERKSKAKNKNQHADADDDDGEEGEEAAGVGADEFVKQYLEQRIEQTAGSAGNPEMLMKEADDFFVEHKKEEKRKTKVAMKQLKEMKAVNKRGGDKDGFMYVVPKNHKELLRLEAMKSGQSLGPGEEGSDVKLSSHFMGDGVDETDKKPMRRHKRKPWHFDDFYEHQKVQKWTDRAESFLKKTRFAKQAKHQRMQGQRNINKM